MKKLDIHKLKEAIEKTFGKRATHKMPDVLEAPPKEWLEPFNNMARECELDVSLGDAFKELGKYIESM